MGPVKAQYRRRVILWLAACMGMVALVLLAGGYTRLSSSGLSITQWKPVHGIIPPLNTQDWQEEYKNYRATPQFRDINSCMQLPEFKVIFWPEYIHRLLGRISGLVFFLPFAWFAYKRAISRRFAARMAGIFALGGLQGVMGWYMVKSGLMMGPYVSHFRLAAHLALALLIFGLLLWTLLDLLTGRTTGGSSRYPSYKNSPHLLGITLALFTLLCLQIFYGALTAGLHGGLIFNTFPTMDGQWIPSDLWALTPWWENPFSNITCVQFIHRFLAMILALATFLWWLKTRAYAMHSLQHAIAITVFAQVSLGIVALLNQVPIALGLLHQFTALGLFALMLAALHIMKLKP